VSLSQPRSQSICTRRSTLGLPGQPEVAFGAIAEGDVCVVNDSLVEEVGIGQDEVDAVIVRESAELERRICAYRGERLPVPIEGRMVILVDDGLATGYTMRAAIAWLRRRSPRRVVVAVPVAPQDSVATIARLVDEVVALQRPTWFLSIAQHYEDFSQVSDAEVVDLVRRSAEPAGRR
jgi:putative phosphoribosyl transferase